MTSDPCPFCAIVKARIPMRASCTEIYVVTAFFPLMPATRGHTLVVPNRHVADYVDLTDTESRQLGSAVGRTALSGAVCRFS